MASRGPSDSSPGGWVLTIVFCGIATALFTFTVWKIVVGLYLFGEAVLFWFERGRAVNILEVKMAEELQY